VGNILLPASCPFSLMPDFNILKRPFIIQNVHSTSLLIDSNHCEKQMSGRLQGAFIEGTVVAQ
jgi:hypothetical protein